MNLNSDNGLRNTQYAVHITSSYKASKDKYCVLRMGILLPLSCFVIFLGCTSENNRSQNKATEPLERLDPYSAPLYSASKQTGANDFEVKLVSGESFRLSEQQGKVVLMNIWATWCPPCHDETPDFVELYNEYKDQGLVVLGVSIDEQGKSVVQPFMEKYSVNYPTVVDDGTIMEKYGPTMGIPTSYIIDKQGDLRYFAVGALTKKELEPRLRELLEEVAGGGKQYTGTKL